MTTQPLSNYDGFPSPVIERISVCDVIRLVGQVQLILAGLQPVLGEDVVEGVEPVPVHGAGGYGDNPELFLDMEKQG